MVSSVNIRSLTEGSLDVQSFVYMEEEQWGENTALRSSSADRAGAGGEFSQPHYLLPVSQEAGDPLTDGGGDWRAVSVYSEGCPG